MKKGSKDLLKDMSPEKALKILLLTFAGCFVAEKIVQILLPTFYFILSFGIVGCIVLIAHNKLARGKEEEGEE